MKSVPSVTSSLGQSGQILLIDMVDIKLTVWMVKRIYTYRKHHTMESKIFSPWSKKVIHFPSLRHNIQAYQDDQRSERVLPWVNNGNTFQFSAPPETQTNPRRRDPGKIRSRWSNKARYNPIKTKRPNTPDTSVTNMDTTETDTMKVPLSSKVCKKSRPSHSFCKQNVSHPSPQESDWSDKDCTGGHTNTQKQTGETNFYQTGPSPNPNLTPTLNWK